MCSITTKTSSANVRTKEEAVEGGGSLQWSSRGQRTKTIKAATRHSWQHTNTYTRTQQSHIHKVRNAKTGLDATSRCDSCSKRLTSKRSRQKAAKINVGRSAKFTQYLKMKKKSAKRHTLCSARLPHLKHTHTHTKTQAKKGRVV